MPAFVRLSAGALRPVVVFIFVLAFVALARVIVFARVPVFVVRGAMGLPSMLSGYAQSEDKSFRAACHACNIS
jgi:hypothetical protein